MEFRPDTSFPYMKIARERDVDYGEVIRFVEAFMGHTGVEKRQLAGWQRDAIKAALAEADRRAGAR